MKQRIVDGGRTLAFAFTVAVLACALSASLNLSSQAWADDAADLRSASLADLVTEALDNHKTDDGNWYFQENGDGGTATLIAYIGSSKTPIVPATAGGLTVTGVVVKPATGAPAITEINLNNVKSSLATLQVYGCTLSSLDVSGFQKLMHLDVRNNELATLKVSGSVQTLMCSGNKLTALDVSQCPALEKLYCDANLLYGLDISKCAKLYYLDCRDNRLTSLKCGANLNLNDVFCAGNYLSEDLKALVDRYGSDTGVVLPQNSGTVPLLVQTLAVSPVSVAMGSTAKVSAKASAGGKLTYSSSNEKVARVSADGTVTPISVGSATLTVSAAAVGNYGPGSVMVKVTVSKGAQTVSASPVSVAMGSTAKVSAKASAGGKLTYSSSNEKVVKVSADGTVTPVAAGSATITVSAAATAGYNAAAAQAKVTVSKGAQKLMFKKQTKKVSRAKVSKKAQKVTIAKATGGMTKVAYSLTGNAKAKKYLKVNKSTGKITVKKGTPKGTYKATVKASAQANANWNGAAKSAKITVKVK